MLYLHSCCIQSGRQHENTYAFRRMWLMTSKKKKVFSRASVILAAFIIAGLFDILGFGMVKAYANDPKICLSTYDPWVVLPTEANKTKYYTVGNDSNYSGSAEEQENSNLSVLLNDDGSYTVTLL